MWRLGKAGRAAFAPLAAAPLVAAAVLLGAEPAYAGETFIHVSPNPARAGTRIGINASCGDANNETAAATSDAFGRVVLMPRDGTLTGNVTIPSSKKPGRYNVHLQCQNNRTADTTLTISDMTPEPEFPTETMSPPPHGPATGGGGAADAFGDDRLILTGGLTTMGIGLALGVFALLRRRVAAPGRGARPGT